LTNYLLDTSVISELVRPSPNTNVVAWMRATEESRLFLSVLTFAEIRRGIERLPSGARRDRLRRWMAVELTDRFEGRILPVDRGVAEAWGVIVGRAERSGTRPPTMDALFAARVARHHEHPLVAPQVSHLRQVPLRTRVKLPHSSQGSPS